MAVGHFMTTLATPWMPNEETQKSSRALFPVLSCHPENALTHRGKKEEGVVIQEVFIWFHTRD